MIDTDTQSSPSQPVVGEAPPRPAPQSSTEQITNPPTLVPAFGKTYPIARFNLRQAFDSLEFIAPFGFLLEQITAFPRDEEGKFRPSQKQLIELAITAISVSGPSALGLISVATHEPVEWLGEQSNPMDGFKILAAVLGHNLDFFSPENIAEATRMFDGLQRAILTIGGSTSTTSSNENMAP